MPCKRGSSWCVPLGLLPAPGWSALCLSFQNQRGELLHENYHCMKSSRRQSGIKYLYIFSSKMMSGGTEGKPVLQEEREWSYPIQGGGLLLVLKQCRKGIPEVSLNHAYNVNHSPSPWGPDNRVGKMGQIQSFLIESVI